MQPQEFRIGNFVKAKTTYDDFNIVKEIGFSDNQRGYYLRLENVNHGVWLEHNDEDLILGIPLTEEWLLKVGFKKEKDRSKGFIYTKGSKRVKLVFKENLLSLKGFDFYKLKHVHQLQNLYFALTGEELKIEKSVCDCGSTDVTIKEYGFYKCNDCNNEWVIMKTKSKTL